MDKPSRRFLGSSAENQAPMQNSSPLLMGCV